MFHRLVSDQVSKWRQVLPRLLDRQAIPEYIKPIAGGLLLGTVGILTFKAAKNMNGMPWTQSRRTSTDSNYVGPLTKQSAIDRYPSKPLSINL